MIEEALAVSALVVWDMQEAIARSSPQLSTVVPAIQAMLRAARRHRVRVVYTQHTALSAPPTIADSWSDRTRKDSASAEAAVIGPACVAGTAAWQLIPELAPAAGELVLPKAHRSLFAATGAESILHSWGCQTVVLTGVATDRGILTTARESLVRGFFPIVVADAVGAFDESAHTWAIARLEEECYVTDSTSVIEKWSKQDFARP